MTSVPAHFQKLVQLVARSFYAGECPPKDEADVTPQKTSKKAQVRRLAPDCLTLRGSGCCQPLQMDILTATLPRRCP